MPQTENPDVWSADELENQAQKAGVHIFWDHDLAPLRNFISANTAV